MSGKSKTVIKTIQPYTYERKGKTIQVKKSFPRKYYIKKTKIKIVKKKTTHPRVKVDNRLRELQLKERDWAHLSIRYPNIIGLTDKQINDYIDKRILSMTPPGAKWNEGEIKELYNSEYWKEKIKKDYPEIEKITTFEEFEAFIQERYPNGSGQIGKIYERSKTEEYIRKIKCLNQNDLLNLSEKVHKDFIKICNERFGNHPINPYSIDKTAFITSPRGGFEILSDYSYANKLQKLNLPVDFYQAPYKGNIVLSTTSLPYDNRITDVNDIVYIDDVCMSGEQENKAFNNIKELIRRLGISESQKPRLHYICLIGNNNQFEKDNEGYMNMKYAKTAKKWDSVAIGEMHDFDYDVINKEYFDLSAIVFPYSIPDGNHHTIARELYHSIEKYRHI